MSKGMLTLHKEILKKEYAESPLGKLEKKLRKFYDECKVYKKYELPEDIAEQIYNIREENEKEQLAYIDESQKRDREKVDEILFKSMSQEWEIINNFLKKNDKM